MSEYVSKQELSQKNKKNRSSMTATEMAAYSALMKQGESAKVQLDSSKNTRTRAKSQGLFDDKLSFLHLFTKNVDITVNNTRFKGKRGHQVRGGAVPITTGLVADYNPAVLKADRNRDIVKFDGNDSKPQIVFVDKDSDNRVNYIPVKVDRDASIIEPNRLVLKSTEPFRMVVKNHSVLEFDGFELTENGLNFTNPKLSIEDHENDNNLREVNTDSAMIGPDGMEISAEASATTEDIDTSTTTQSTDTELTSVSESTDSPQIAQIIARQTTPQSTDAPAQAETTEASEETEDQTEETQSEEKEPLDVRILDSVLSDDLGILRTVLSDTVSSITGGDKKQPLEEKLSGDMVEGITGAVANVIKLTTGEIITNETVEGHVENAIDTVTSVANSYIKEAIGIEEQEEDEEREDEDEEIPLSDFIKAFIDGDTESVAGQRIEYAKKMLKTFMDTGKWEDEPDDETLKLLHLQTSEGDKEARNKLSGYEFEGDINILPWLYGFASITPEFALKVDADYSFEPEFEIDPVKLAENVAATMGIGHKAKAGKEAGEAGYNARMINKKEEEKLINGIIASVKIGAGVSVALIGNVGAEAKLGLGVGNPFLFGVEGYIGGGLKLGGKADDKNAIVKLSAKQELTLEELAKDDGNLLSKKAFGDSSFAADIKLGVDADVSAAARIRSRLLSLDYELAQFLDVSYNLADLDYKAEFKRKPGGRFFGFEPETAFSAKAIGASLKQNSSDGKYGFKFDKKNTAAEGTMEVLNQVDVRDKDVDKLLAEVTGLEGKELSSLNEGEIDSLIGKLKIADYDIDKLMKASAHAATMLNNNKAFQTEIASAEKDVEGHESTLRLMQEWSDNNASKGLESLTEGSAYEYYLSQNGGNTFIDKTIKSGIRDEVIPTLTTRDKLLEYETGRLSSYQKESDDLIATLLDNVSRFNITNINEPNAEYTAEYMKVAMGLVSNGIKDSLSLYANPEDIRNYERAKIALETKKHKDRISSLEDYISANGIANMSSPNPKMARYYVNTLGATSLKNNLSSHAINMDRVLAYEESYFNNGDNEKLFASYNTLKGVKDQYDNAEGAAKEDLRKVMNGLFIDVYGEEAIRDKAYRMYGGNELIAYEEGRIQSSLDKATKGTKKEDGSYDMNKLMKVSSANVAGAVKNQASLEELLQFELTQNLAKVPANDELKGSIIRYRANALTEAIHTSDEITDPTQRKNFIDIVKKDYFSGELDRQALRRRNDNNGAKKTDEQLKANDDFIKAFIKDAGVRNEELNGRVTDNMKENVRETEAATHIARIKGIKKMQEKGASDGEIYQAYKDSGATQFMSDIRKEYKTKSLEDVTPEQMMRFAAYKLHKNTRANFFTRNKRFMQNYMPIIGANSDYSLIESFEKNGHFGRWEKLVALRDSDEYRALSPKEQNAKLHKFYTEELLGGSGLQSAMEADYANIMTPDMIMNYEKQRVSDISIRRNKRLQTLDGKVKGDDLSEYKKLAMSDGEGIGATFKWLWKKVSGNYTIGFDEQAKAEDILSPANIIDYEVKRKVSLGQKHQARVDMLRAATGKTDKEVYDAYVKMGGGNGFLSAHSAEIKAAEKSIMDTKYNGGNYSLDTIMEFERGRLSDAKKQLDNTKGLSDRINGNQERLSRLKNKISEGIIKLQSLKRRLTSVGRTTR